MGKKKVDVPPAVSPLLDEETPLTCLLIADLLGLFLKCNPAVSYVYLPDFRILELCSFAACLPGKKNRIQDGNMFEAIGAFYCLCMYYGGTIVYEDIGVALHAFSVIQSVLSECIISFEWLGESTIVHTDDRIDNMEFIFEGVKQERLEVFTAANDLLKAIIRDIIKQVRSCRDSKEDIEAQRAKLMKKLKKDEELPHPEVDCLLMHSVYLAATYAMGHVAGVVYSENSVIGHIVPGLYESLLCVFHIDVVREGKKYRRFEKLKKKLNILDPDRFEICIQMSKCISYMALKNCNVNFVNHIRTVRGRLSRVKSNAEIEFASIKASGVESDLFLLEKNSTFNLSDKEKDAMRIPARDRINLVEDVFSFHFKHRSIPSSMYVVKVGKEVPESLVCALEDVKKDKSVSHSLQIGVEAVEEAEELTGEYKDMDEMCQLSVFLRPFYLLTRCIREYYNTKPHYFNPVDRNNRLFNSTAKTKKPKESQHSQPQTNTQSRCFVTSDMILNNLEQAYYDSPQRPWPRFLNQTEGLYWVCNSIIERIFHEVKSGRLFIHVNEPYLGILQSKMKKDVMLLRNSRVSGTQEVVVQTSSRLCPPFTNDSPLKTIKPATINATVGSSDMKSGEAISTKVSNNIDHNKNLPEKGKDLSNSQCGNQVVKSGTGTILVKKKHVKKLDLMDRLNLARKEAALERRLEILHSDGEIQKSVLQRERFQLLEKKFKPLDDQSEGDDAASSVLDLKLLPAINYATSDGGVLRKKGQKSVVWRPPPEVEDEMERRKKLQARQAEKALLEETARNFSLPAGLEAQGKKYAEKLRKAKEEARKKAIEENQERGDMHEAELAFVKKLQAQRAAEKRAYIRNDVNESLNIKKRAEKQKKEKIKQGKNARKAEKKQLEDKNYAEVQRIEDYRRWNDMAKQRESDQKEERKQLEQIRLKNMSDKKEYEEILRRIEEENRMRYLEGIQRKKEDKRIDMERKKATELMKKQKVFRIEKEKIINDIRVSNFMYHNGKLGYYRGIRDEPLPFIQYEDDWGYPYYLDPLTNATVYELPDGVPVLHHTEKEKIDYDQLYGEGAYDELMAEREWKLQCNKDKGYYDDNGLWVNLQGYYDENFEFVQTF